MIMGSIYNAGLSQTKLSPPGGFSVGGPATVGADTPSAGARSGDVGAYTGPFAGESIAGQPLVWFLGIFAMLGLLKLFSQHPKTPINPEHLHIGGYNLVAVGVTAVVFIAFAKLLVNRFPVPGLYQVINAV